MSAPSKELMVKGNVYVMHRNYIVSKWGEEKIRLIETGLQKNWSSLVNHQDLMVVQWIPHRFFVEFNQHVMKNIQYKPELIFRELGKNAIKQLINKVMISMLKMGTPNLFATIAATLWGRNYNMGKVEMETEKDQFSFSIKEFDPMDEWTCHALLGCLESYVELIGYKVVFAKHERSVLRGDSLEKYTVKWTKS